MPTEAEMMADLAAADAAGDTQLAQHIAGLIKQARSAPAAAPGRGEFQEAEGRREVTDQALNIPAAMLTPDPATNRMMAEKAWEQGLRSPVKKSQVVKASMAALGGAMVPMSGVPAAVVSSGLLGGGLSGGDTPGEIAGDTAKGAVTGFGLAKMVPAVAGKVAAFAGKRLGAASARATAEAAKERAAANASAQGLRRQAIAENNRSVEWIQNLLSRETTLSAADRAALEAARGSPEYAEAVAQLARRLPERLGESSQHLRTAEQAVESAKALPSVAEMAAQRVSAPVAREQVWNRLVRYGPPAIGSAIGASIGGPVGVGVGALAGAGTRPAIHALRRMVQDPAVQTQIWTPVERIAAAMSQRPGALSGPVAPAVADPILEMLAKALGRPRLAAVPAEEGP